MDKRFDYDFHRAVFVWLFRRSEKAGVFFMADGAYDAGTSFLSDLSYGGYLTGGQKERYGE